MIEHAPHGLTITAIVCAYNEARFLPACLYSLLAQTRPPDEIIVINNASTDETGAVARAVPGVRVRRRAAQGAGRRARDRRAARRTATSSPTSTPTAARRFSGSSGSSARFSQATRRSSP